MSTLSVSFWVLFILIFLLYWSLKTNYKLQNFFLLIVNYVLYSLWDIKFSGLLLAISLVSYLSAILINNYKGRIRKLICSINVILYIVVLFLFKYYNFFTTEFAQLLGVNEDTLLLHLLLPVGISFYIFTTIGYVVDVYKEKREAVKELIPYLSFISFFPLILSGPIERSTTLLPQFLKKRIFSYELATIGVQQVIWGLFKKMVLADNCATIVNTVFSNYSELPASSLVIGAILYSVQIYCDFSGYSDMAIGISKLLGFNVRRNFNYPYFAINVSDFWRRWHMSLQQWFVDYIYIPLGGSRCSTNRIVFNTFVIFVVCGIWHGANWTFIVWGFYHAFLFVPLLFFFKGSKKKTIDIISVFPTFKELGAMAFTFCLITIGWIVFNSPSIGFSLDYICGMVNSTILAIPSGIGLGNSTYILILITIFFLFEWMQRKYEFPLLFKAPGWVKVIILYVLIIHIVFCNAAQSDFIYFQF